MKTDRFDLSSIIYQFLSIPNGFSKLSNLHGLRLFEAFQQFNVVYLFTFDSFELFRRQPQRPRFFYHWQV